MLGEVKMDMPYYGLIVMMKKNNKTQDDLANELSIDRSTFNLKLNRTKGRDFTLGEAQRLSEVLGSTLEDFF